MVQHRYDNNQKGYITLITVLIIGVVGLGVAVTILFTGTGLVKTSLNRQQSTQARALADACAETALQQIRNNSSFSGTSMISLGAGTCSYTVVVGVGPARTVNTTGTVGTTVRKVQISLTTTASTLTLNSWLEVAEF